MQSDVQELSSELNDELAANSRRPLIDPRSIPVRYSWLKAFAASPLHAFQAVQDLNGLESTLATRLGSGAHGLLLGNRVVKWDGGRRFGKTWDEYRAANSDAVILTAKEYAQAWSIAEAVRGNELASRLLFAENVRREETLTWEIGGRKCQGTPDARSIYTLTDLKTAKTSHPDRFVRDATWRGYHAQLAWYRAGIEAVTNAKPRDCYIVAVESKPPFAVTVLRLTERALEQGERLVRVWWEQLRVCEESGTWPAYAQSTVDFDVPDDDFELNFGGSDESEAEQ